MLAATPVAPLENATGPLEPEPPAAGGRPRLDANWLELIAAVRTPLARLEAHQALGTALEEPVFAAATNHPNDPWLQLVPPEAPGQRDVPHLVVVYGPKA